MKALVHLCLALASMMIGAAAQKPEAALAEVQKCEDRIASVRRDVLNKYEEALAELQSGFQKIADLEGAVAVRAERQRLGQEKTLSERDYVAAPKALRSLQVQSVGRMQELIAQLVGELIPKLVEVKKQFTIAGKLDEALAVRGEIERLQNEHVPLTALAPGAVVSAEALINAYAADRARADRIYKGQKLTVRGVVGAFRPDPADAKSYQLFLSGTNPNGWVQCSFASDSRLREERSYNVPLLVITGRDGETVRLQKGSAVEIAGVCEGWDEAVRLGKCALAR